MSEKQGISGRGNVSIGGNATGNQIVTGDHNQVSWQQAQLPDPESVDIRAELKALREALTGLGTPLEQLTINNALTEAEATVETPEVGKDGAGTAIQRALDTAQKAKGFIEAMEKIKLPLVAVVAWLGAHWDQLLTFVRLRR